MKKVKLQVNGKISDCELNSYAKPEDEYKWFAYLEVKEDVSKNIKDQVGHLKLKSKFQPQVNHEGTFEITIKAYKSDAGGAELSATLEKMISGGVKK